MMNFFFRVDASSQIGSGHLIRCLTLAKVLKKNGAKCTFICGEFKNNLIKKIKKENFKVVLIHKYKKFNSYQINKDKNLSHFNWVKLNWRLDAHQTIQTLINEKIDYLIVDHYGIDKKWEKKLRPYVNKIMVIDDLANRNHDCDLLLDQNLIANFKTRYKNILPKYCVTLLGPQYAILQDKYKYLHSSVALKKGLIKRILVYFGATDQNNLIEMTLYAFLRLNRKDITLDIILSSGSKKNYKINKLSKKNNRIKIYTDLTSLAPLMLKADIAIGACGMTLWERFCAGLPSIIITIANNQKSIAKELHNKGLIHWLGHYDKITNRLISDVLETYLDQNLRNWSKACKLVTDGHGAETVASILTLHSKTKLKLRFATKDDEELLLNWANDPLVRRNSFNPRVVSGKTHKKWFNYRLKNTEMCIIFIFETKEKVPVGQVRFEKKNKKWHVNYSLASFAQKKKISYKLLKAAISKFKKFSKIKKIILIAEVKKKNLPSYKLFEKIGFVKKFLNRCDFDVFEYRLWNY